MYVCMYVCIYVCMYICIEGAKLISLNEKQRGFPVGLRFMKDTSYKSNFVLIEPDFENGFRNEDIPFRVTRVEVSYLCVRE